MQAGESTGHTKEPLCPFTLIKAPFERIGMDLIGPLDQSAQGHHFVLVLVDYATRYPESVPPCGNIAEAIF